MVKGRFFFSVVSHFVSSIVVYISWNFWSLVSTVQPLNTSHSTLDRTCSDSVVSLSGRKSTSDLTTVTESSEMPATASHHRRRGSSKVSSFFVLFAWLSKFFFLLFLQWFEFNSKTLQVVISQLNRKNHQTETLIWCASSWKLLILLYILCLDVLSWDWNERKKNSK